MYVSIGEAVLLLGVSLSTLRRWEADETMLPNHRTIGNQRRYNTDEICSRFELESNKVRAVKAIGYSRVSSHDQKKDLLSQGLRLEEYCSENFADFELISDLGSGLSYKKPRLNKLLSRIQTESFTHLILTHKDMLLRFGSEIIFSLCRDHKIEVIIIDDSLEKSFEKELSSDVIELMTVFARSLRDADHIKTESWRHNA
ncbi:MAG: IS607 family transposase [Proteobacteria bacterium]|nr:MAG: IS607 family transposase [Pseudomonadota bacterium]